jgi:glycosyltransferase involved in cell wall biosynthesis
MEIVQSRRRSLRGSAERDDRPLRLLVLAPFPPARDAAHGGARSIAHLLDRLSERHDIALLFLRSPHDADLEPRLRERLSIVEDVRYGTSRPTRFGRVRQVVGDYAALARGTPSWVRGLHSEAFATRAREIVRSWAPDVVQLEYPVMGQYLRAIGAPRPPVVLVEHDAAAAAARELRGVRRGRARGRAAAEALAWRRSERRLLAAVDSVVVFTDRDARAIRSLDSAARLSVIPLGADVPDRPLDAVGRHPPTVLFVGSFGHEPNVDAAVRLVRDILPRLGGRFPDVGVEIVGHAPPASVRELEGSRVAIHADVPDVRPFLERASVVVAPVRLGGGMRVKVLEALAAGKAVVATPRAIDGIGVTSGVHLLVADDDDAFAAGVARLLDDPQLRAALGASARAWAVDALSWGRSAAMYEELYATLTTLRNRTSHTS